MTEPGETTEAMSFPTPDVPTLPIDGGNGSDGGDAPETIRYCDRGGRSESDGEATQLFPPEVEHHGTVAASGDEVGREPSLDETVSGSTLEPASDETANYPGRSAARKSPSEIPKTIGRYRVDPRTGTRSAVLAAIRRSFAQSRRACDRR